MKQNLFELVGPKGWLIPLFRTIRAIPLPIQLPVFGTVSTLNEVLNIHDNFCKGELRHQDIERYLRQTRWPTVVDCGVNVGVSVRWWRHINPQARVIGIDMMEEAHAFTWERLAAQGGSYEPVTCALAARGGRSVEISFDDPLSGDNSVTAQKKAHTRRVQTQTLDGVLLDQGVHHVDLLKIDLEGYGAEALKGGTQILPAVRYVVLETHTATEMAEATAILHASGFELIAMRARSLIYQRPGR